MVFDKEDGCKAVGVGQVRTKLGKSISELSLHVVSRNPGRHVAMLNLDGINGMV